MSKKIIELYKIEDRLNLAVLECNGVKHYTADIRIGTIQTTIVTSRRTLPDEVNNEHRVKQLIEAGVYTKIVIEVEVIFEAGFVFQYTTFDTPKQIINYQHN